MSEIILRSPAELATHGGTQPRAEINVETAEEYAEAMKCGVKFPPVVCYYDGEQLWLADGFHRRRAAIEAGIDLIEVEVRQGTKEDAQWHSYGANQDHGLRRTNADKKRAVEAALRHPKSKVLGSAEIARHCGVSRPTVDNYRAAIMQILHDSGEPETREVTRNGTTYQQRKRAGKSRDEASESKHVPEHPAPEPAPNPWAGISAALEEESEPEPKAIDWEEIQLLYNSANTFIQTRDTEGLDQCVREILLILADEMEAA